MKGISRRARACAVVAATGVAVAASAGAAHAQAPASVGEGVPTGQGGVQMFNYGGYIGSGGSVTGGSTGGTQTAAQLGLNPANAADGSSCATATSQECRDNRVDALFGFLQGKGVENVEMFGWSGFPANSDIAGLTKLRGMLDKNNLHCAGWHGDMSEAAWDARLNAARILGCDSIGSGGEPSPGIGSYDNTLKTVEALNRLGKKAVEAGVGQVYFHNHQGEFRSRYVDNGVRKTAWQIMVDRMDARYAFAEVDAGWSSDAYDDVTGNVTAGLINSNPTKIKMLHIKDMKNTAPATPPASGDPLDGTTSSTPVALGTGEIDFRPIFNAAKNRVEYYHQEHDGGSLNDAAVSLTNLKGTGSNVKGAVLALPTTFDAADAGKTSNKVITVTNKGDGPLSITAAALQTGANAQTDDAPGDFQIVSNTCVGATLVKFGTCTLNVNFKPTSSNKTSVAHIRLTSSADDATETFLVAGKSTANSVGSIGGDVPTALSLTLGGAGSFGSFAPATARNYDTAVGASVVSTAGDATLSVADTNAQAPGHLVNGTFALAQPLQVRANNAANTGTAFSSLSETAGTATTLLTYAGPTAGADGVTINFRQAIGANDVLRSGSYSKTLTFTLSTTTP